MIDATRYVNSSPDRRLEMFATCAEDRPLVAQLCCNAQSGDDFLAAAARIQNHVDAVDINLGCPQERASKEGFGAFMCDKPESVLDLVRRASHLLQVPMFCKIRILPAGTQATVDFAKKLQEAGCACLCMHGRTREQTSHESDTADWQAIKAVRRALSIPVIANGGIRHHDDVERIVSKTRCVAAMSATALLRNPALFRPPCERYSGTAGMLRLAVEYLHLCTKEPGDVSVKGIESHIKEMLLMPLLRLQYVHCPLVLPDPLVSLQTSASRTLKNHHVGIVKFYNGDRGFGMIRNMAQLEDPHDVAIDAFFRQTDLLGAGQVLPGDRVAFTLPHEPPSGSGRKKKGKRAGAQCPKAKNVERLVRSVTGFPEQMFYQLFVIAVMLGHNFDGKDATKAEVKTIVEAARSQVQGQREASVLHIPNLHLEFDAAVASLISYYRAECARRTSLQEATCRDRISARTLEHAHVYDDAHTLLESKQRGRKRGAGWNVTPDFRLWSHALVVVLCAVLMCACFPDALNSVRSILQERRLSQT
ncbi:hypothetical protein CYMTET_19719 [Cymbomonas tetramitiformis]|uniref:tRNA-dihydrouridine(16/17) synthase [NAD(P)(+)] n=1 Tax=Cymbomonas tetramitiformis TaxID=36881 RepID=A0AAE0G5F8_9CHLO|nr:hypothetical protein CYMTET_19719 [Cymbomonas tetramitiformis]